MKDDVCCHWGFKDEGGGGCRVKRKRKLSENFHLSPHMKALFTQSQGFGRPGVFSEDFDGDGRSEREAEKKEKKGEDQEGG